VDEAALRRLLDGVQRGAIHPDDAVAELRRLPYADLGFARVDHHRQLRQGMAEAVYGPGKTPAQCAAIVAELLARSDEAPVLLTRSDADQVDAALAANPGGSVHGEPARPPGPDRASDPAVAASGTPGSPAGGQPGATVVWRRARPRTERVALVTAGTADLPVAGECAAVLGAHGLAPSQLADVGVAGVHRLLDDADTLATADAVVVVAGMEGALASVVGGLTGAPVVAVPTSVGYGAGLGGITALLAMHASCAAGITVTGIDNGYGAACAVVRLVLTAARRPSGDSGGTTTGTGPLEPMPRPAR
jgi:NCAIR mutase (PurE)-related protein